MEAVKGREAIERCVRCQATIARDAIVWDCVPVPSFGDSTSARVKVAVVGLNPALNEFRDIRKKWKLPSQRLPVVNDYKRKARQELSQEDIEACRLRRDSYFSDPVRQWHRYFEPIEEFVGRINWRWSFAGGTAVHVDLVACPTQERWSRTAVGVKDTLVASCRSHFLHTLEALPAETVLLLNGGAVCGRIEEMGERCRFDCRTELIAMEGELTGRHGSLEVGGRRLPFFGWSACLRDVGRIQRLDLVLWIRRRLGLSIT